MRGGDWEEVQSEVTRTMAIGREVGELELETITRIVYLERQENEALRAALEKILKVANSALRRERAASYKADNILEFKPLH